MARAVRFDRFGGPDVLRVVDVPTEVPGPGQARVTVRASGVTGGESAAREGALAQLYPTAFPSGEGAEFAGVVTAVGPDVPGPEQGGVAVGEEVLGWSPTPSSHADSVVVPVDQLVPKPAGLSWEEAGALYVDGVSAYACVEAVGVRDGDLVVVSAAASDVGSFVVQLARLCGATVIGLCEPAHHGWLHAHGADALSAPADSTSLAERVRARTSARVDAFIDAAGGETQALARDLGVDPARAIATTAVEAGLEFGAAGPRSTASRADVLRELTDLVATGRLHVPIAATFALEDVQAAFAAAEDPHRQGKIVLLP